MGESGESEIEDDDKSMSSDGDLKQKKKKKIDKKGSDGEVYKAPKINAVAYEDSKDRKKRQKEEY